ncbi:MAG: hypothetical protein K0Q65_1605 [Clostridia bacterium]|nr:hypothetical protein [Clostridia bacterium]
MISIKNGTRSENIFEHVPILVRIALKKKKCFWRASAALSLIIGTAIAIFKGRKTKWQLFWIIKALGGMAGGFYCSAAASNASYSYRKQILLAI